MELCKSICFQSDSVPVFVTQSNHSSQTGIYKLQEKGPIHSVGHFVKQHTRTCIHLPTFTNMYMYCIQFHTTISVSQGLVCLCTQINSQLTSHFLEDHRIYFTNFIANRKQYFTKLLLRCSVKINWASKSNLVYYYSMQCSEFMLLSITMHHLIQPFPYIAKCMRSHNLDDL